VTTSDHLPDRSDRWTPRRRTDAPSDGAPAPSAVLHEELSRIERRLEAVIAQGRHEFSEGSDSYDRATVAVLRLASLFEEDRFRAVLGVVTTAERRGIITTRNIAAHSGYSSMDIDIFWRTVTERLPGVIERIRAANL